MLIIDRIVDEFKKQNFILIKTQKNNERNKIFAI